MRCADAITCALVLAGAVQSGTATFDPAAHFDARQRAALASGTPVVSVSPAAGTEIAVVAAGRTDISTERFLTWSRQIELIQASSLTPVGGRFSNPPQPADLAALTLNDEDLSDLRSCRAGSCGLKLSAREMAEVRSAIQNAGPDWRRAALESYKRALIARVTAFHQQGTEGMPPYEDDNHPVNPRAELVAVLAGPEQKFFPCTFAIGPSTRADPERGPESYLYWSKNVARGAREVVTITQLTIYRCGPNRQPVVVSAQVYASHYLDASVSYTTLAHDGTHQYLLYLRRVRIDLFRGWFGGFVRSRIERRVRHDTPKLLAEVRRRLESGAPAGPGRGDYFALERGKIPHSHPKWVN